MKRVIPLLLAVGFLGFACRQQAIRTMNIRVPAMTDAEAAARVEAALKSVHGVRSSALVIDLAGRSVTVTYDELIVAGKNIEFALAEAGFDANDVPAAAAERLPPKPSVNLRPGL